MKPRIGSIALRLMRPLFNWRVRIVHRTFVGPAKFYDATVRAAIEAMAHLFEGWVMAPNFARLEAQLAEAERINRRLAEIRRKFGLDAEDRQSKEHG